MFCRFVVGQQFLEVAKMNFLQELQRRRSDATIQVASAQSAPPVASIALFDLPASAATKKKARADAKCRLALGAVPHVVSLQMDGFEHDGAHIPATTLRVKSSADVNGDIMVELDEHMIYTTSNTRCPTLYQRIAKATTGPTRTSAGGVNDMLGLHIVATQPNRSSQQTAMQSQ